MCPQKGKYTIIYLSAHQLTVCLFQIMWHAADLSEKLHQAASGYHFSGISAPKFDWATFKPQRDAYIRKLNGIYESNLAKEGVEHHHGFAKLLSPTSVQVTRPGDGKGTYTLNADYVCVATGGRPTIPSENEVPGASKGIDSDGFFDLEEQPRRVAIIGAGYIAVELAGVLNALGSETHLLIRGERVLRTFDQDIQDTLTPWMEHTGVKIHKSTKVVRVDGERGGTLTVRTDKGEAVDVDVVLWAVGRHANTEGLGLEELGVKLNKKGDIVVDEYQNTNVDRVLSIGDVQGNALLTPVAIAAGRRLSNRLFGPEKFKIDKLDYDNIPTVVFSFVLSFLFCCVHTDFLLVLCRHPTIGTVGLTERQAREKYGDAVKICTKNPPIHFYANFTDHALSHPQTSQRSRRCTSP
jgi:glutathione reductase (NADPH)